MWHSLSPAISKLDLGRFSSMSAFPLIFQTSNVGSALEQTSPAQYRLSFCSRTSGWVSTPGFNTDCKRKGSKVTGSNITCWSFWKRVLSSSCYDCKKKKSIFSVSLNLSRQAWSQTFCSKSPRTSKIPPYRTITRFLKTCIPKYMSWEELTNLISGFKRHLPLIHFVDPSQGIASYAYAYLWGTASMYN